MSAKIAFAFAMSAEYSCLGTKVVRRKVLREMTRTFPPTFFRVKMMPEEEMTTSLTALSSPRSTRTTSGSTAHPLRMPPPGDEEDEEDREHECRDHSHPVKKGDGPDEKVEEKGNQGPHSFCEGE